MTGFPYGLVCVYGAGESRMRHIRRCSQKRISRRGNLRRPDNASTVALFGYAFTHVRVSASAIKMDNGIVGRPMELKSCLHQQETILSTHPRRTKCGRHRALLARERFDCVCSMLPDSSVGFLIASHIAAARSESVRPHLPATRRSFLRGQGCARAKGFRSLRPLLPALLRRTDQVAW